MEVSDAELVHQARQGHEDSFSGLVERHWSRLVPFARSVVGEAEAEDAVQDGLVIAWEKLGTLRDPAAFGSWVLRIVGRLCLRRARAGRRWISLASVAEPADPRPGTAAEQAHVEQVLRLLAPRQRAVMHLTLLEGMSDSEIGAVLGINPASVRSHRRRARERLREALAGPEAS